MGRGGERGPSRPLLLGAGTASPKADVVSAARELSEKTINLNCVGGKDMGQVRDYTRAGMRTQEAFIENNVRCWCGKSSLGLRGT